MSAHEQHSRPFTALPIELKTRILQEVPDLESLQNISRSCSAYHNAYTKSREKLLNTILRRQCGDWIDELLLVVQVKQIAATLVENEAPGRVDAAVLLRQYRTGFFRSGLVDRRSGYYAFSPASFSYEEIVTMLQFRRSVLRVSGKMCGRYTAYLNSSGVASGVQVPIQPTREEEARICAAICRWEVFCAVFSPGWVVSRQDTSEDEQKRCCFSGAEVCRMFLYSLLPWELEGMACVFETLKLEYGDIFQEIVAYVREHQPDHPSYAKWYSSPEWFDNFDIRRNAEGYDTGRVYLSELGITFFDRVSLTKDHVTRDGIIASCISHPNWQECFHGLMLYRMEMDRIGFRYPPGNFTRENFERYLIIPQPERPSAGWIWLREQLGDVGLGMGSQFDQEVPLFAQMEERGWGYVFWGRERLEEMGVFGSEWPDVLQPEVSFVWLNI